MTEALHRPVTGIFLMCVGVLALTVNDACTKWLKADYSAGQIIFVRGALAITTVVLLLCLTKKLGRLRIRSFKQQTLRGAFSISGAFLMLTALGLLPLADAIAITFAGPLFVGAMAGPVLGEKVGWRRWLAIIVGFIGVLLIMRPGSSGWSWAFLLPLAVAATDGARDLLTRHMSTSEDPFAMMVFSSACLVGASLFSIPFGWKAIPLEDFWFFLGSALSFALAHMLMIEALRQAEAGLVSPYKYTSVIWAILIGILIWGDWPDQWVVIGSLTIVASGLYVFHRERLAKDEPKGEMFRNEN